MSVSAVTSSPASTSSITQPTANNAQMNYEQFMQLLVVQLQNQNPLEPMNDRDFYAQMAQLGQVQGMEKLQQSMDVTKAQSLMGKTVTATLPNTNVVGTTTTISGTVSRLSLKNGTYYVGLQTPDGGYAEAKLDSVQSIEPTQDLTQLAALIGKNANGTMIVNGTTKDVSGSIVGIDTTAGAATIRLQTTSGIVSVPLSNLTKIGG